MRDAAACRYFGIRSSVGDGVVLVAEKILDRSKIFAFDVHDSRITQFSGYFHRPVSIQLSIRRIGSSHSHTIPATT